MRKIIFLPLIAAVFMMLLPAAGLAATEEFPLVSPLLAGQTIPVGEVRIWNDADNLYVKFVINDGEWCLREIHVDVRGSLGEIPQTKQGGPIPGQFTYKDKFVDCAYVQPYAIPLSSWVAGTQVYIAAHAVVQTILGYSDPDLEMFAEMLPQSVTMSIVDPLVGAEAYFPEVIVDGDPLTGTYLGWCVDTANPIYEGELYTANVFSSYETLPSGVLDKPENLQYVNWILNQDWVGQYAECSAPFGLEHYTYGSVQRAIWSLIDDTNSTLSLGPWSNCQVQTIIDDALSNGLGFTPGCDDIIGIILQPFALNLARQVILYQTTLAQATFGGCDPQIAYETAWAAGTRFVSKGTWATYFTYSIE